MPLRLIHAGRAAAVMVALACVLAAAGLAQTDRPRSNGELAAAVEQLKSSLDAVAAAARDARTDQALAELLPRIALLRDELRQNIAALEPRLALVDTRLKQTGEPPAATAAPEEVG